jgi:hypothetical protein
VNEHEGDAWLKLDERTSGERLPPLRAVVPKSGVSERSTVALAVSDTDSQ